MSGYLTNIAKVVSNITAFAKRELMLKPMRDGTISSPAVDRVAIERWEGEGGRVLAPVELSVQPNHRGRSDLARQFSQ